MSVTFSQSAGLASVNSGSTRTLTTVNAGASLAIECMYAISAESVVPTASGVTFTLAQSKTMASTSMGTRWYVAHSVPAGTVITFTPSALMKWAVDMWEVLGGDGTLGTSDSVTDDTISASSAAASPGLSVPSGVGVLAMFHCDRNPTATAPASFALGTQIVTDENPHYNLTYSRVYSGSASNQRATLAAQGSAMHYSAALLVFPAGAPPAPVITGPTGSAGAASITTTSAENQNVAGVWTATNSATWSLSGTDASLLTISGGTVTKVSGNFDFENKASYSFTVNNGSASQAVTLNITDVNEAPSFIGPAIGALVLTQGVAMTPVNIAAKFTDPEGLTVTGTVVESLPAGLSVVSGTLQGTPTTLQAASSYTPRGADPSANGTNGTTFTIQVVAPAPAISAPIASATGTTTATAGFTTDLTGGNAFFLRRTGTTPASQATVAATGESQAVTATGAQTRNMTAFTSGVPYYVDMTQTGAVGVVSAGPFTPSTMTASGAPDSQSGTTGALFAWNGSTPSALVSGGTGSKTWTLVSAGGSGLSSISSSTGVPAGTLTSTAGTYQPVLRVTDSSTAGINPTGGGSPPQTIDFTLTLIVGASGAATAIVISNASPQSGLVGALSNNFTVGANGTITGTIAVTPSAGTGGGTFVPTSVNISSGSPTATFKYLPASTGDKAIGVTNNGGLTNPSAVTYTATSALATSLSLTLTTDGITPIPNLTGLKVAVYDQPTPDLWAGHTPIYATAAGTTDVNGVLTCDLAGLTTLVPGALAGLSISNSDGTVTQGAAQRGYVGPAVVA